MVAISIIINNHNYERFLRDAIESALAQVHSAVEVIVVDDGSTDNSREIIQNYGERLIPIIKNNGGQASALNAGFAACHGEIVIFLDADDMLMPSASRNVAEVFQSDPGLVRVQYRMQVVDERGIHTGAVKPAPHIPVPSGDVRRRALTFPFDMPWLPTSGNAFATKALRQIMPIPEKSYGRVGADWYLSHLTSLLGPVFFLDRIEACYRVHRSNHYELSKPTLDMDHIRQTILYCRTTNQYLQQYAGRLGLPYTPGEILSVSYIANRMTSLRLEAERHPILGDTRWRLVKWGAVAAMRRFDVSMGLKFAFMAWFMAMALVPKPLARLFARQFFFPEERKGLNLFLGKLHLGSKVGSTRTHAPGVQE
jgi:hypothetical protein